ncbi:aspartyl-phosphate phosphatase Spo0E family protein [Peptoclostridium sp.]|uniref:aspartyl-phosphate phosphatase Spo0E family protein n=1 Tax=Peptoclostridium sp. TaxID=1904860 RepID=UPI0025D4F4FB|nr:aspartyl-phosphate phosphatase Spo0E family protein [Peptoclostridium sp.]
MTDEIKAIKKEIEELRESINRYIEYPDIFEKELLKTSRQLDKYTNEYMRKSMPS